MHSASSIEFENSQSEADDPYHLLVSPLKTTTCVESAAKEGTVLVICGCWHCIPLSEKAEKRGHTIVAKVFHPENLSELKAELF